MANEIPNRPNAGDDTDFDDGFEDVAPDVAKGLLREESIGIIGIEAEGAPELRPVNYAVHRADVIIRTDRGLLFEAARNGLRASLAVTRVDEDERRAWSVVVKGRLTPGDAAIDGAQLFSWAHSGKEERIRLSIDELSGRRIEPRDHD